jgi:membrane fusion protein (multidrug efflux system)
VRPQVSGILKARLFEEGAEVQAGDVLYQIDPALFEASYNSARAALARSEATLAAARLRNDRAAELVKRNAVSVQEAEDASAAYKQALASVAADRATVEAARINLGYASVTAPISGKIGRSSVTQGALVTANQGSPLATIQQIHPIYIDITQSSMDMLRLRRNTESGMLRSSGDDSTKVTLLLEDGAAYAEEGQLQFSEVSVDPSTGSVTLRALVPNPGCDLLPGMFVRASFIEGTLPDALLVPQQAVSRNYRGQATAWLVTPDGKAHNRIIGATRTWGDQWIVTSGLEPGDKVVVNNLQRIRPDMTVTTVPWTPPALTPDPAAAPKQ